MGMFDSGSPFKMTRQAMDYVNEWTPKTLVPDRITGGHNFEGAAISGIAQFPEVDSFFTNHYVPGGTFFKFEADFPPPSDRHYEFMRAQANEFDHKKRVEIIKDFQRYSAEQMYVVPIFGVATNFGIAWPWAGNWRAFRTRGSDLEITWWLDKSKMKA
jgi:ABC-type transport system substrate-binding protein